jgi:hypothetical protein
MAESDRSSTGVPPTTDGSTANPARAAELGSALKQEGGKLADKSVSSGVDAAEAVGKAAESAAQALDQSLPLLAGYVRNAAQYTERFADNLRDKKAEELMSGAIAWSREQPLMALAGAAMLGFALSRVAKAGLSEPQSELQSEPQSEPQSEFQPGPSTGASPVIGGGHEG